MIATKQEYNIQGIELEANILAETVWATISLKDQRKLVVGSYYRPPLQTVGQIQLMTLRVYFLL